MYEDYAADYYDEYGGVPQGTDQGFFSSAIDRVQSFVAPVQDFSKTPVGSQLFSAIYEFGRGKIDAAREKAVGAFLMTSEGKKAQATAARQTLAQYLPLIVVGIAVIFFAGTLIRR